MDSASSSGASAPTHILCLGSPHGDDQVAWLVAQQLRSARLASDVRALREPFELLEALVGAERIILVDAAADRDGRLRPGTILEMTWPDDRLDMFASSSTHGFTAARVLGLAQQLGRLPAELRLLVVGIEQCSPGEELSRSVARAVPQLIRRIQQLVAMRHRFPTSPSSS